MVNPLEDPHFFDRLVAQTRLVEWSIQKLPICQLARRIGHPETPLEAYQREQWAKLQADYYERGRGKAHTVNPA